MNNVGLELDRKSHLQNPRNCRESMVVLVTTRMLRVLAYGPKAFRTPLRTHTCCLGVVSSSVYSIDVYFRGCGHYKEPCSQARTPPNIVRTLLPEHSSNRQEMLLGHQLSMRCGTALSKDIVPLYLIFVPVLNNSRETIGAGCLLLLSQRRAGRPPTQPGPA